MKITKSKTGQSFVGYDTVMSIVYLLGISLAAVLFVGIIGGFDIFTAQVPQELELRLIMDRFIMSPECLAYQDPLSGRVYPGIVGRDRLDKREFALNCFNPTGASSEKENPLSLTAAESLLPREPIPYAFRITIYEASGPASIVVSEKNMISEPYPTSNWNDNLNQTPSVKRPVLIHKSDGKNVWGVLHIEYQKLE